MNGVVKGSEPAERNRRPGLSARCRKHASRGFGLGTPARRPSTDGLGPSLLASTPAASYDPATGQFLTRDPAVAMTMEPYAYAANDPVNLTDPTGLWPWDGRCIRGVNCPWDTPRAVENQDVANFAGGVLNTITFGNEERINSALCQADKVDRCSGHYTAGEYAGYAVDAVNVAAAGRELFSKAGLRIAGSRMARGHIDEDVHVFQMFGREFLQPHIQFDTWRAGVKGSGNSFRIPLPKRLF